MSCFVFRGENKDDDDDDDDENDDAKLQVKRISNHIFAILTECCVNIYNFTHIQQKCAVFSE